MRIGYLNFGYWTQRDWDGHYDRPGDILTHRVGVGLGYRRWFVGVEWATISEYESQPD